MPGDPADVGGAPEHVRLLQVEGPVHRELGPQQVAAGSVLHTLGFAGRTRGVQHEQRVLRAHRHRRTLGALSRQGLGKRLVATRHHVARRGCALVHEHGADGLAAAHAQPFVHDSLERKLLAAAHLVVGGYDGHRARVDDALLQSLGRKPAEHHAVGDADARAGLHRDDAFQRHRHVDQHAVALADALGLERVGELAHACEQFTVGGLGDLAVVRLEDHGGLVLDRRAHVFVQAIRTGVKFAVVEPFVERRIGLVQRAGEGLAPHHVGARQAAPETFEVPLGLRAQRVIGPHAGNPGGLHRLRGGRKYTVLHQDRFNRAHDSSPQVVAAILKPVREQTLNQAGVSGPPLTRH